MNSRNIIAISALLFSGVGLNAMAATAENKIFENEKAITFTANDGQTTDAYEGSIQVPENRAKENSRLIPVKYVRFPATGNKKGSPIIYLSGGPGGSGIGTAKWKRFPMFMDLREYGDVIALDQRGTGASKIAPHCISKQVMPFMQAISEAEVAKRYKAGAQECMTYWQENDVDPYGYTTVQNALDIDDLRKHLNADKVSLWGISYGSHLALASLKALKGKIDKVVIASAEGLNQTVKFPARTDAYFARLQQAVNTQPAAAKAYPDINALMKRVHKKLEAQPLAVKIPRKDDEPLDFLFQQGHMQGLASMMIADPNYAGMLLGVYDAIDNEQVEVLTGILARGVFNDNSVSFNVMSFAMDVASGITAERKKLIEQQAKTSLLGLALNFPMPMLDRTIEGLDLGDDFRAYPQSDVPTLLLTGTLDGRTYIEGQKESVRGLSNVTQVMVKNAGHNLYMSSPEVTDVIKQFLNDEKITTKEIIIDLPQFVK